MKLTKEQILKKLDISFLQFLTIDKCKCEHFGDLVQGAIAYKQEDGKMAIQPFHFILGTGEKEAFNILSETDCIEIHILFVQHYIRYS